MSLNKGKFHDSHIIDMLQCMVELNMIDPSSEDSGHTKKKWNKLAKLLERKCGVIYDNSLIFDTFSRVYNSYKRNKMKSPYREFMEKLITKVELTFSCLSLAKFVFFRKRQNQKDLMKRW